jgi:hypothetical protein
VDSSRHPCMIDRAHVAWRHLHHAVSRTRVMQSSELCRHVKQRPLVAHGPSLPPDPAFCAVRLSDCPTVRRLN